MLIYLIDDDDISLYIAEQVIELAEFAQQIQLFSTAEAALSSLVAHLPTQVPQVIFLDLNMPHMDGWDFLQALAPHEAALRGRCHIYILTSSLALADTARAQDYSLVAGVLYKPLDDQDLQVIMTTLQGATKADSQ